MNDIKLGISLYSFSTEFIHEKLDLEGILKKAHDMGCQGVEIVQFTVNDPIYAKKAGFPMVRTQQQHRKSP